MAQETTKSNQNNSALEDLPGFLKLLNAKPGNSKVGQTFITFTKKPQDKTKSSK